MVVQELKFVGTVIPKYRECKDSISFLGAVLTSLEKLSEQLLVQSVDDSSGFQEWRTLSVTTRSVIFSCEFSSHQSTSVFQLVKKF